jgi:hypothetical protein
LRHNKNEQITNLILSIIKRRNIKIKWIKNKKNDKKLEKSDKTAKETLKESKTEKQISHNGTNNKTFNTINTSQGIRIERHIREYIKEAEKIKDNMNWLQLGRNTEEG